MVIKKSHTKNQKNCTYWSKVTIVFVRQGSENFIFLTNLPVCIQTYGRKWVKFYNIFVFFKKREDKKRKEKIHYNDP